jgi:intraflagellar transport protein 172
MTRLVGQYHPELVQTTNMHLAQEMEAEQNWKGAEQHYLNAGDWKGAVNMYRASSMWEDAYRVSRHQDSLATLCQI